MAYTKEQILRISADRKAVSGYTYVQDNGDMWKGTSDGRIVKLYTSDLMVGTQPESTEPLVNLRQYLANLILESNSSCVKQVEVDFRDTLYINYKTFVITDPQVKQGDFIVANIAYDAPTGKSVDEIEMDSIICTAGLSNDGSFTLLVRGLDGSLRNKFKVNYQKTWQL